MTEPRGDAPRPGPRPPLFTAGHSTRTVGDFLALLTPEGIQLLVDVRRFPASRRHPQFARDALAGSLAAAGIDYMHEPDLGGRRPARPDSPNTAWRVAAFRGYADHMDSPAFRAALARLLDHAARRPTVILCAEAVPWRCHRRLIADAATVRGVAVRHILAPGRTEPHHLEPTARVVAGHPDPRLIYDADADGGDRPRLPFPDPREQEDR